MITRARWPFVVLYISSTASTIEPMSPVPDVPLNTPQSMRMCWSPFDVGTMTRKKSPNPTRYIRTLRPLLFDALLRGDFFAVFLPAVLVFLVVILEPRMQHVEV